MLSEAALARMNSMKLVVEAEDVIVAMTFFNAWAKSEILPLSQGPKQV